MPSKTSHYYSARQQFGENYAALGNPTQQSLTRIPSDAKRLCPNYDRTGIGFAYHIMGALAVSCESGDEGAYGPNDLLTV